MRAVLLCAGFGTRLHPLTRDRAKPLLEVAGRPILDDLVEQLVETGRIADLVVVSNARFHAQFQAWRARAAARHPGIRLRVLDDGARAESERRGAVGDLAFALSRCGIPDDLLVAGADNLLRFPLDALLADHAARPRDLLLVHRERDAERLRRTGVVELDPSGRVVRFLEKPREPPSQLAVPPLYLLRRASLELLDAFRTEQPRADAPGTFLAWLARRRPLFALELPGRRLDVGDPESYRAAGAWLAEQDAVASRS